MLSRVADALFWMSRYLERAESMARLVDVCYHLGLDLQGLVTGPHEMHWTTLLAILQQPGPKHDPSKGATESQITEWLTFDSGNPNSIVSCVSRARDNARSIRGSISSMMWRELNKLYWHLKDSNFNELAHESPHEFYQTVEHGSWQFQGVCDATLSHDEGWHFIQLGK